MNEFTKTQVVIAWICRIVAAAILLQTLFFKFTAAPESVYIFTNVGIEPWGRIGSEVAELIAAILLFVPGLGWLGAALALGMMGGAILSHLTLLGMMFTGGLIGESKYETLSALAEATRSGWRKVSLSGRAI